jgi:hypothetical protein
VHLRLLVGPSKIAGVDVAGVISGHGPSLHHLGDRISAAAATTAASASAAATIVAEVESWAASSSISRSATTSSSRSSAATASAPASAAAARSEARVQPGDLRTEGFTVLFGALQLLQYAVVVADGDHVLALGSGFRKIPLADLQAGLQVYQLVRLPVLLGDALLELDDRARQCSVWRDSPGVELLARKWRRDVAQCKPGEDVFFLVGVAVGGCHRLFHDLVRDRACEL